MLRSRGCRAAATALLAGLAGCGGGGHAERKADAEGLASSFKAYTSNVLNISDGPGGSQLLRPVQTTPEEDRFGPFTVYVNADAGELKRTVRHVVTPVRDGVVIVTAGRGPRAARAIAAVRAAATGDLRSLPAAERQCSRGVLDLTSRRPGTCRLDNQQLTVGRRRIAASSSRLGFRLDATSVSTSVEGQPGSGLAPLHAHGRFLVVRYTLTNPTTSPLLGQFSLRLRFGRHTLVPGSATVERTEKLVFPLQPGSATLTDAFDVPTSQLAAARRGVLEFSAGLNTEASGIDQSVVGRVLL